MNLPKQLINLLGVVVIIAILVAGITLIALPLYTSAQTTDVSTRTVAQSNDVYGIQVAQLSAESERIDEIESSVAQLRRQISSIPQLDDVMSIVMAASAGTGATVESVTVGEIESFEPRTGAAADQAAAQATASDPTAQPDAPQTATDEGAATAEGEPGTGTGEAAADQGSSGGAAVPSEAESDSPQRQIPITIQVKVATAAAAARFMDALGAGPRLIATVHGAYDNGTLLVSALAFMRTGD